MTLASLHRGILRDDPWWLEGNEQLSRHVSRSNAVPPQRSGTRGSGDDWRRTAITDEGISPKCAGVTIPWPAKAVAAADRASPPKAVSKRCRPEGKLLPGVPMGTRSQLRRHPSEKPLGVHTCGVESSSFSACQGVSSCLPFSSTSWITVRFQVVPYTVFTAG